MYLASLQTMRQSGAGRTCDNQEQEELCDNQEQEEQKAVKELKEALVGDEVMSYFDPQKRTEIIVDASLVGLGGLLVQEGKVLSYASRALSDVEGPYSQTEREMLAVVWAAEHFYFYVYGVQFTIITDHKPLTGIFSNHKQTAARI